MNELVISWSEYLEKVEQLAYTVYQSHWEFNQILCIARGGLLIGDIFSRIFRQPLAILSVASYGGIDGRIQEEIIFSSKISMTTKTLGSKLLLIDDLVDSGLTMRETLQWLKQNKEYQLEEIKTAVIWHKDCSTFSPDFYVEYLDDNPWICQPFSIYEGINLADWE